MNHEVVPNASECCAASSCAAPHSERSEQAAPRPVAVPRYRVTSGEDGLRLDVELPGVAAENVTLYVEDGVLHLAAQHSLSPAGERIQRQALEFRPTDFHARWRLPEQVDADAVATELRHGVLGVTLPLRKPARRKIAVG